MRFTFTQMIYKTSKFLSTKMKIDKNFNPLNILIYHPTVVHRSVVSEQILTKEGKLSRSEKINRMKNYKKREKEDLILDFETLAVNIKTKLFDMDWLLHISDNHLIILDKLDVQHRPVIDRSLMITEDLTLEVHVNERTVHPSNYNPFLRNSKIQCWK